MKSLEINTVNDDDFYRKFKHPPLLPQLKKICTKPLYVVQTPAGGVRVFLSIKQHILFFFKNTYGHKSNILFFICRYASHTGAAKYGHTWKMTVSTTSFRFNFTPFPSRGSTPSDDPPDTRPTIPTHLTCRKSHFPPERCTVGRRKTANCHKRRNSTTSHRVVTKMRIF